MQMTLDRLPPIEDEIAALDEPDAVADRRVRAEALVKTLWEAGGHELDRATRQLGMDAYAAAIQPFRTPLYGTISDKELRAGQELAQKRIRALLVRQTVAQLRIGDENALYACPERQSDTRIWQAYLKVVENVAFRHGDQAPEFLATWQKLIANRAEAEVVGESTASMDRRLEQLRVPYPKLPEAAWVAADTLNDVDRPIEYARLEQRYGPRTPDPAPTRRRK